MIDTKEAEARIAFAEFEARRLQKKSEERSRRWRQAAALVQILLLLAVGVYLQVADQQISGAQACGLLALFMGAGVWQEHLLHEKIRALEAAVTAMKLERENKKV